MKCLSVTLLFAFGAAAYATESWIPGQEYVYEYKTRTMTGIPSLKTQVSGLGLRSKIVVQPKSPNELVVKMTKIEIARAENQIFSDSWSTWRRELPLSYSPLESSQGLSIPFKVNMKEGQVQSIETSETEPVWCVNIKRALASQLSLNVLKISGNHAYNINNEISKEPEEFYTVEEPSVTGECKTYYTIVPLPDFIARSEERDLSPALKSEVGDRPAFIVTKTKDFTFCKDKPAFIHSSVVDENERGSSPADSQHKRFSSRTSVTRYLIRGKLMDKFVVERVWTEGEYIVRPFATNTESIFITSNQTLVLEKKEPLSNRLPEPSNMVRKSLVFEFIQQIPVGGTYVPRDEKFNTFKPQGNEYLNGEEYRNERSPYPMMNPMWKSNSQRYVEPISPKSRHYPKLTKAPSTVAESGERVPVQNVIQQIQELLQKVENNLESWEQQSQKEPQIKMLQVARALKVLSLQEIEEAYNKISPSTLEERTRSSFPSSSSSMASKTKKNLFEDAAAMCGTNPCIMFLKLKILSREIQGERAAQLIMVFPATVKTPTPDLLRELVQLVKGTKPFDQKQVWYTALLSIATLINRACIDKNTRRHNWSVSPVNERPYCTRKDAEILLPYLKEQLDQTNDTSKLIVLVQAIGNLGIEESYPLLRPFITGKVEVAKQVRVKAIFAVSHLFENSLRSLITQVQSTLMPIFSSPLEPTEVRLAAYVAILKSRPDEAFFTEVATSTWFEPSQHVAQFVTSSLEALANCTFPTHVNISRKATMALPLAKKFNLGVQYSRHVINSHIIPERRIGSMLTWTHLRAKWSLIPENIYMSLKNHLKGFDVPFFEGSLHSQGTQSLMNHLFGPAKFEGLPSDSVVTAGKDYPTQVNLWMKFMGNMERMITADILQEWGREGFVEYTSGNEYIVNYQKALPLQDTVIAFPVDSGLPIYVSKKTPLFISIRGSVQLKMDMERDSMMEFPHQANLKLNLKPLISISHVIEAGISSPLTNENFISGHKTSFHAFLPGHLEIQYRNKEVEIVAERQHELPSKIELIAIKSTPFTGRTEFYNFVSKNLKPIEVQKESNYEKFELKSLEKSLGLVFQADVKMDQPLIDFAGLYNLLQPHTVLTAIQFVTVPETLKKIEYNLKLDLSRSETKTLKAKIYYSSERTTFSLKNFEEEERLEKQYYKEKKTEYYNQHSDQSHAYFTSPELALPELQYLQYERKLLNRSDIHSGLASGNKNEELSVRNESYSQVSSVHTEVILEGSASRRYRSSIVMSSSPDQTKQQLSVMIERESSTSHSHWFLRANSQFKFPLVPMKRELMLETHMNALGFVSVKYGTPAKESSLTARFGLRQTKEWRKHIQECDNSRECSKHEHEGVPFSCNCLRARRKAQSLNWMAVEIESHNTPSTLKNLTLHFDDFLKAVYYHHMTNKRFEVQNPTDKVKIVLEIKPVISGVPYPILDVYMYKPNENTFWEGLKVSPLAEAFLPLSAKRSSREKAVNTIMGYQYTRDIKIPEKEELAGWMRFPQTGDDFIEGDIKIPELSKFKKEEASEGARGALNFNSYPWSRWPANTVAYTISPVFSNDERRRIMDAMREFESRTCLKFVQRTTQRDFINIKKGNGCWSSVGHIGGPQDLSLGQGCLYDRGTPIHELMHAIGFFHEQSRPDRDDFVTIHWDEIHPNSRHNFNKMNPDHWDSLGSPYDWRSVMHYQGNAFAIGRRPTITSKPPGITIGQQNGFSEQDLVQINKLYGCSTRMNEANQSHKGPIQTPPNSTAEAGDTRSHKSHTIPTVTRGNCPKDCTTIYDPVCGNDGVTYPNLCSLQVAACRDSLIQLAYEGECRENGDYNFVHLTMGCPNFGQNNWSLQCDFFGNDFRNIQVPSDRCGQACWDDPRCTHFTWTGFNGGTCWMKEGRRSFSDAVCSEDSTWVCGCLRDCDRGNGDLVTGVLTTFHGANEAGSCQLPSASYSTSFAVALGSIPSLKHITYRPSMCGKVLRVSGCGGRDIDVIVNNANIGGGLDLYGSSWNAATGNASPGQKFCNVQVTNNNLFSSPGYVCYYEPNSEHNNQYFHLLGLFNTGTNEVVSASLGGIPGAFNGIQPYFAFHGGPIGSDAPVKFNFKSGSTHTVALRDCRKVRSTQKWG